MNVDYCTSVPKSVVHRSLLEMYADFFTHPDSFVLTPTLESAEERYEFSKLAPFSKFKIQIFVLAGTSRIRVFLQIRVRRAVLPRRVLRGAQVGRREEAVQPDPRRVVQVGGVFFSNLAPEFEFEFKR